MPFSLEKDHYKIRELTDHWEITSQDVEYLILTKEMPIYVFLSNAVLEIGKYNITPQGRILHHPKDVFEYTGLKQLRPEDVDMVLRNELHEVHDFMPDTKCHYTRLTNFKAAMKIRLHDLIIKTLDCRELNIANDLQYMSKARKCGKRFAHENNFRMVKLGDDIFHFGDVQAAVIKALYEARNHDQPWIHVKQLLHGAGSSSMRMTDVFKTQKDWRKLIQGNGKGYYQLEPSILVKEKQKQAS